MKDALELIHEERRRQQTEEGYTTEHDCQYEDGVIESAARCYALHADGFTTDNGTPPSEWPWDAAWWKPTTKARDLTKAGALYLAAADRAVTVANRPQADKCWNAATRCAEKLGRCSEITGEPEKARLFYWEEGVDAWVPVPFPNDEIPGIETVENMERGEVRTIEIRRCDMTDAEFAALEETC